MTIDIFSHRRLLQTVALLTISNIFMTIAWYGHLKYKDSPLWAGTVASVGLYDVGKSSYGRLPTSGTGTGTC